LEENAALRRRFGEALKKYFYHPNAAEKITQVVLGFTKQEQREAS